MLIFLGLTSMQELFTVDLITLTTMSKQFFNPIANHR